MQQRKRSSRPQQEYVVQSGDNAYQIAKSNGVALKRLLEANELGENSIIHPGDILNIPSLGSQTESPQQEAPQTNTSPQSYTVRPGDSLWGISDRLGISMNSLMQMNNLAQHSTIHPNQRLQIPGSVPTQTVNQSVQQPSSQQATSTKQQIKEKEQVQPKEKPKPNNGGHAGYDPVLGKALAAASMRETGGRTRSQSDCYKYVANAVDSVMGRFLTGMHAYMAASQLASRKNMFTEISAGNLSSLPAGAIVVWGKGNTRSGHISIAQGNGKETSDFIGNQMLSHYGGAGARVFLPKARM